MIQQPARICDAELQEERGWDNGLLAKIADIGVCTDLKISTCSPLKRKPLILLQNGRGGKAAGLHFLNEVLLLQYVNTRLYVATCSL